MIKTYSEYVTEALGKLDAYRYIINAVEQNLSQHSTMDADDYIKLEVTDGICYVNVSGKYNEPISACESNITFMMFPPNFKPNLLVSLENNSYKPNTSMKKFQIVDDQKLVESTKKLYKDIEDSTRGQGEYSTILITIGY